MPASWTISASGVGPVVLGQSLAEARAALGHFTEEPTSSCPNPQVRIFTAAHVPTVWLLLDESASTVLGVRLSDNELASGTEVPHTAEGVGTGSAVSAVQAAYRDLAVEYSTGVTNYSLTSDTDAWITFSSGVSDDQATVRVVDVYPGAPLYYELCG